MSTMCFSRESIFVSGIVLRHHRPVCPNAHRFSVSKAHGKAKTLGLSKEQLSRIIAFCILSNSCVQKKTFHIKYVHLFSDKRGNLYFAVSHKRAVTCEFITLKLVSHQK
jgi:hypothetical protein